jgi:tRNA (guanine37-N1)-methyltransferase
MAENIVKIRDADGAAMVLCIRVPKKEGESVRSRLVSEDMLDLDARIRADGDHLLIPIRGASFGDYEVVDADLQVQEHAETDYRVLAGVPDDLRGSLPNSYDVIGDVAVIKLPEELVPYRNSIGEALMKVTANLRTVMLDSGVKGEFRVRDLEQIAGSGPSATVHREFGLRMHTDPAKVYFNPRLATERMRIASLVRDGEVIIDMFAGVAPFPLVICRHAHPEHVYAIDLNPEAGPFARKNVECNHLDNITCITGDAREVVRGLPDADRVIMNLPQMAVEFLPDALSKTKVGGTVHLHGIMDREELDAFKAKAVSDSKAAGFDAEIVRCAELKTYSPTMSVYVFDIVRR